MRYKITIIPFMDYAHITVTGYPEEPWSVENKRSYVMPPSEGETEHLYSVLSWLAGEIASRA